MELKELRKSRALTQKELAKRAGVSQGYICALEKGKKQSPSLFVIKNLALGLGVSVFNVLEALGNLVTEETSDPQSAQQTVNGQEAQESA